MRAPGAARRSGCGENASPTLDAAPEIVAALRPMLFAQLTDPHVSDDDPGAAAALGRAVAAVLALRPAPDAVLVTGDLADHASPGEYARVEELLAPLPMPVAALAGNHDDPAAIDGVDELRAGGYRILLCETAQPGRDDGRLDVERLAARLDET